MRPLLPLLVAAVLMVGCNSTKPNGDKVTPPENTVKVVAGTYKVSAANKNYTISEDFWIDKNEVTNAEYAEFLASEAGRGLTPPKHWKGGTPPAAIRDRPVHYVSFEDARKYAEFRKKVLPTVQQWEAAARGPDGFWYPWGNSKEDAGTKAHLGFYYDEHDGASPIGRFSDRGGNSWVGCRDMLGNVFEWTTSKKDGVQIVKGGSFKTPESLGDVNLGYDGTADGTKPHEGIGFRCVWTPKK